MKSVGQLLRVAILAAAILLNITLTARCQPFSLSPVTASNSFGINHKDTITNAVPPNSLNQIPLIEFEDVPITVALENLARQAGFNYILDPQIGYNQPNENGQIKPEPTISVRWVNIMAEQAFATICKNYGFTTVKDTNADVVFVRQKAHDLKFMDSSFYANDTNIIPVVEFTGMPMVEALKGLAKQARIKCIFGTRIENVEPGLSIRWQNITATQAFAAVCENYDLNAYRFPNSSDVDVEPAN